VSRYPVGFSGDVQTSYKSLAFQPSFTASASNVGFVFWSHDLGSFGGRPDPELFVRWLQFGAFSPIFRTHCSKSGDNSRYPWTFDSSPQQIVYSNLRKLSKLRQSLVPYLYTSARRAFETGLGVMLPLFYEWPQLDMAYQREDEYLFGEHMLIAPITTPIVNSTLGLVNVTIDLPPGVTWVNFFSGDLHVGPKTFERNFTLSEMPAYVRAGAIIPMLPDDVPALGTAERTVTTLKLLAVIGGATQGNGSFYDDAGDSSDYVSKGTHAFTTFSYAVSGSLDQLVFNISEASDRFVGQSPTRAYEIHLRGTLPAVSVNVSSIGSPLPFRSFLGLPLPKSSTDNLSESNYYSFDGNTLTTVIYIATPLAVNVSHSVSIQLSGPITHPALLNATGFPGLLVRWRAAKVALDYEWGTDHTVYSDDYPSLLEVAQSGEMMINQPTLAQQRIKQWPMMQVAACQEIRTNITHLRAALQAQLLAQLC